MLESIEYLSAFLFLTSCSLLPNSDFLLPTSYFIFPSSQLKPRLSLVQNRTGMLHNRTQLNDYLVRFKLIYLINCNIQQWHDFRVRSGDQPGFRAFFDYKWQIQL
jgi:hypothetical protein